jgi:pimeloyl-ACP methyl ester carboxylesterase
LPRPTATRESIVSAGGVEVFVRERGAGRPLLLINGLGGNVDMWGTVEDRLASVARTIAFDAPGTGRSTMPVWPHSVPAMAKLAALLLDELGYEEVDVAGYSLGGVVAQELARAYPDRVRRIALISTAVGWGSVPGTREALTLAAMPQRYYSRDLYEHTKAFLSPVDREVVERVENLRDARLRYPPSIVGHLWQLWACSLWSSLSWLHRVDAPTLVLHGIADDLVPAANAVQLARLLPNSRLQIVPGTGHLVIYDPRAAAVAMLESFFTARRLQSSHAWSTGLVIDDDAAVESAFAASAGEATLAAMSLVYRRYVRLVAQNGNGSGNRKHAG